jgi:hypothetical protein
MKRTSEGPLAVLPASFHHPPRALVARHDTQAALREDGLESRTVTAGERPSVPDLAPDLGHLPARAALHFLMQA